VSITFWSHCWPFRKRPKKPGYADEGSRSSKRQCGRGPKLLLWMTGGALWLDRKCGVWTRLLFKTRGGRPGPTQRGSGISGDPKIGVQISFPPRKRTIQILWRPSISGWELNTRSDDVAQSLSRPLRRRGWRVRPSAAMR